MDWFLTPLLSPLDCGSGSEKREQYRSGELPWALWIKMELIFYCHRRERRAQSCPDTTSLELYYIGSFHLRILSEEPVYTKLQVAFCHSYSLICLNLNICFLRNNRITSCILFRLLSVLNRSSLWYELCAFPDLCHWHVTRSFYVTNHLPRDLHQLSLMHDLHMLFHACFTAHITWVNHAEY